MNEVKRALHPGTWDNPQFQSPVDWNKVAYRQLKEELRRQNKKTPEEKRIDEIKAGVIVTSIGVAASLFLFFLLTAVASTEPADAAILYAVRWVGLIPLLIGLGILFNGIVLGKRQVELIREKEARFERQILFPETDVTPIQRLAQPAEPVNLDFSVTETTTTKLREPIHVQSESSSDSN
ncbi:MAG: hypothetical protein IPM55_16930 [Acidobacteria bacterium]|nr:hypothetical protein [Acidobacteriota bacterium]